MDDATTEKYKAIFGELVSITDETALAALVRRQDECRAVKEMLDGMDEVRFMEGWHAQARAILREWLEEMS